ncbi:DNA primase [Patescibacteria group bacterium]
MSDIVSDIKSRLSIEDVVAQYVQLKQAGKNFKGLCPFHQEKTPSFMVSPEKQLAYCFGCHKGGDMIAFVEEVEGVEFKEAVKILADKCGLDPAAYSFSEQSKHSKSEKEQLYEIHNKTLDFYVDKLWNTEKGQKVLEYLRKRGLKDDTIKEFKFGFAPDSFEDTHMHLVKLGYARKTIALSGIAVAKDTDSKKVYDRFRMRLIIPIYDSLGRIVGFGGRALKKDDNPKYLNSSDSPIYKKSEVVYGYNFAKEFIKKENKVIITEGYFDVIMSHQEGIKTAVASSGTALTQQQIKLFKRLTKDLIFCFDTDKAGIEAAKRGFDLAMAQGMNVNVIQGLDAKDPADFINDHPGEWEQFSKKAVPFMDFCINQSIKNYDLSTIEGKKHILADLIPYLDLLPSTFEKDHYIREIAAKLDTKEVFIYDAMKKFNKKILTPSKKTEKNDEKVNEKIKGIELIFGLIYEHPELFEDSFKDTGEDLLTEDEKSIYNTFKDHYNLLRAESTRKDFLSCLDDKTAERFKVISMFVDDLYGTFSKDMLEKEFKLLLQSEKRSRTERKQRNLSIMIKQAEEKGEKEVAKDLLLQLKNLVGN